jgi:lipoprotein-releasing system ATP-binding protein
MSSSQTLPLERSGRALDIGGAEKLRVAELRKSFLTPFGKKIEVLRDVSFSAAAGETIAVMGASGAGKSTLLNLLGGLETGDGGTVIFSELKTSGERVVPLSVSFVFQFHYLLPDLTAAENVAMPLMVARVKRAEALKQASDALRDIGLGDRLTHRIGYLSGGEQQRVAIARALITRPKLILADEPTGNLDASIAEEIGGRLVNYCREQQAIAIVATHNERLAHLCDRVLRLEHGIMVPATPGSKE